MNWNNFILEKDAQKNGFYIQLTYIDMTGDLISGLLLSQIIYWHLPSKSGNVDKLKIEKDGRRWIAKSNIEWFDEIRLTVKQVKRAKRILKEKGIIETNVYKFDGSPTSHYCLNKEIFLALYDKTKKLQIQNMGIPFGPKGTKPSVPKGPNHWDERDQTLTENTTKNTTKNNSSFMHSEKDFFCPAGKSLTPSSEENSKKTPKTPLRDKKKDLKLIKNPQKSLFDYYSPSGKKEKHLLQVISNPDHKIIDELPSVMDDYDTLDEMEYIIDKLLKNTGLPEEIFKKLEKLDLLISKTEKKVLLQSIDVAKKRKKTGSLSYLWGIVKKNQNIK